MPFGISLLYLYHQHIPRVGQIYKIWFQLMYHIYVKSRGRLHTCSAHLLSSIECKSCASLYLCIYLSFDVDRVAYIVGLLVITRTSVQSWTLICLRKYSGVKLRWPDGTLAADYTTSRRQQWLLALGLNFKLVYFFSVHCKWQLLELAVLCYAMSVFMMSLHGTFIWRNATCVPAIITLALYINSFDCHENNC